MPGRLPSSFVNAEPCTPDWFIEQFVAEADRFASTLAAADLSAPIASCPGWDVSRLAEHLGQVYRWANFCAANARPPSAEEAAALESYDPERAADWYRECADEITATMRSLDPASPTWHPFPVDRVAAVWPRRQAHETTMHRWDLQAALGAPDPIDPRLASDGIDEYFDLAVRRILKRDGVGLPTGSLHVHCTDVDGEWLVWNDGGEYHLKRAHEKGDAALRGPAAAILLRLWGRATSDELSPVGDESVLADWLGIAGM